MIEQNPTTKEIYSMDVSEIRLFQQYREQLAQGGLTRDRMPYTVEFGKLRLRHDPRLSSCEFWRRISYVLKRGEKHIEVYLIKKDIRFAAKPFKAVKGPPPL